MSWSWPGPLGYLLIGPSGLDRALRLEWRFVSVRWLALVFLGATLILSPLSPERTVAGFGVLAVTTLYNLALQASLPAYPTLFKSGYVTMLGDSLLVIALISAAGGFDSPFAYLLFALTVSVAMRYGYGPSLAMVLVFVGFDVLEEWPLLRPTDAPFAIRSGFLAFTAILASYLRAQVYEAEAALQRAYADLAAAHGELQRAYADLAGAHQELLGVDEMKTTFLANVSHELRTPLSSIRAFSELLLSYDDPAVQREFLQIVNAESERLTRLVNDVLDISKIEAGKLEWRMAPLDLAALLSETARTYAPLVERNGLQFVQDIPGDLPTVAGDRDRLQQVLANLLDNATKFTEQGHIALRARHMRDEVHVTVSDTGIGIASEDHERIFQKFQQVGDSLTDKPSGTGLGLAISRDIIAHHGGRLWVEAEPGHGSTFTFSLTAIPHTTPVPPVSRAAGDGAGDAVTDPPRATVPPAAWSRSAIR